MMRRRGVGLLGVAAVAGVAHHAGSRSGPRLRPTSRRRTSRSPSSRPRSTRCPSSRRHRPRHRLLGGGRSGDGPAPAARPAPQCRRAVRRGVRGRQGQGPQDVAGAGQRRPATNIDSGEDPGHRPGTSFVRRRGPDRLVTREVPFPMVGHRNREVVTDVLPVLDAAWSSGPGQGGIIVWYLLDPTKWNVAFNTVLWPILGFIFLPWTTLMWVLVASDPGNITWRWT